MRLLLAVCALLISGCTAFRVPWLPGRSDRLTQEELRDELGDFANHFRLLVTQAADEIQSSARNPSVRRRALLWKVQIVPLVEEAALEPNPQEAFVSVLTLVVSMRQYLVAGDGRMSLGEHQAM